MKIIGLTGLAGSGKDTARTVMQSHFGCKGLAFADPMRAMLAALLESVGAGNEWMTQRQLKELPVPGLGQSYRVMAQRLGTEWGRSLANDFWLKVAGANMAEVMNITGPDVVFVVSDVRFDNEARWIKSQGGVVWSIWRPEAMPVADHVSEGGLAPSLVDATIINDGDIEQFKTSVFDRTLDQLCTWGGVAGFGDEK